MNKYNKSTSPYFLAVVILTLMLFWENMVFTQEEISVVPCPKSVISKNLSINLTKEWGIVVNSSDLQSLFCAQYLNSNLSKKFSASFPIQKNSGWIFNKNIFMGTSKEAFVKEILRKKDLIIPPEIGDEGYYLDIAPDSILIVANKPNGLFYGVVTLLQIIRFDQNTLKVPAVKIVDFPDCKVRGVHILDIDYDKIKQELDTMSQLKINTVVFSDWDYFSLNKGNFSKVIKEIFNYSRQRFIEPIPEVSGLGSALAMLRRKPYLAEGIWVENKHFKFINDEAIPIESREPALVNVIRTEDSNIEVKDLSKTKLYKENIDYKVIDGSIPYSYSAGDKLSYSYSMDDKPTKIIRVPSGRINDGEEVLVSYDYIENKCASWAPWSVPYCLSSQAAYKVVSSAMEDVIKLLNPTYISIGISEIRGMNRDSRCRKRNLTNAQLLAEHINKLYKFIKSIDPNIKVIMWDDMINPWHNGGLEDYQVNFGGPHGKTDLAADLISKDIIVTIWWFWGDDRLQKMKNSPGYFGNKGFDYLVSSWKDKRNIRDWIKIANDNKRKCLGVIDTTWDGWFNNVEGIKYTAELSW